MMALDEKGITKFITDNPTKLVGCFYQIWQSIQYILLNTTNVNLIVALDITKVIRIHSLGNLKVFGRLCFGCDFVLAVYLLLLQCIRKEDVVSSSTSLNINAALQTLLTFKGTVNYLPRPLQKAQSKHTVRTQPINALDQEE